MTDSELKCDANFINTPKEILQAIEKCNCMSSQYFGWLEIFGDDVVLRIWACKRTKKDGLEYREVIRATPYNEGLVYRDMYLTGMAGWRVVYSPGKAQSNSWYGYNYYSYDESDFGKWMWMDKIGINYSILNLEVLKYTRYKYCGYSGVGEFLKYIRMWIQYPETEYLGKMGLRPSIKLLKKAKKDKSFARFLKKVLQEDDKYYGVNAIIFAYENNISLAAADTYCYEESSARRSMRGKLAIKESGLDYRKVIRYCESQECSLYAYDDYIRACKELGLDLLDTKNSFPKDFRRMHDLRTNQYASQKKKIDARKFKAAAEKYKKYEISNGLYAIIIPEKAKDLKREGKELNHCVGTMGYDNKMINGVSFIAFVRKCEEIEKPYVTVEYGLKDNKVLQCYGYHDSKPQQEVIDFVNDWGKKVKKEMKAQ